MIHSSVRRWAINTRGQAAVIFGLIALPIFLATGMALDLSRQVTLKRNLQAAIDAAALAGAKTYAETQSEDDAKEIVAAVFETTVSELVKEQTMTPATTNSTENDALQAEAEKQAIAYVQNVKAFHMNWIAAIVILPVLYILNQRLSPQFDWFFIVAVCWGAAIALHALVIFGMFSVFSGEWEQKQFQNKMDELKRR